MLYEFVVHLDGVELPKDLVCDLLVILVEVVRKVLQLFNLLVCYLQLYVTDARLHKSQVVRGVALQICDQISLLQYGVAVVL